MEAVTVFVIHFKQSRFYVAAADAAMASWDASRSSASSSGSSSAHLCSARSAASSSGVKSFPVAKIAFFSHWLHSAAKGHE
jgi:hypothetical protein